MMQGDQSKSMCEKAIAQVKSKVHLTPETQKHSDSGHSSAPDPGAVDQSAAVPSGSPGK